MEFKTVNTPSGTGLTGSGYSKKGRIGPTVYKKSRLAAIVATAIVGLAVGGFTVLNRASEPSESAAQTGEVDARGRRVQADADADKQAAAGSFLDESSAEIKATLPLFHRVNDAYFRGAPPARGGLPTLSRLGVKTIVDLRSKYDHTDEPGREAELEGFVYYWLPTSVWNPPTDLETAEFLKLFDDGSKGPFFVFCADGLNRVGEMTAIYRIIHDGWATERALKEMDDLGFNPFYYSLRNYVWSYSREHRTATARPWSDR